MLMTIYFRTRGRTVSFSMSKNFIIPVLFCCRFYFLYHIFLLIIGLYQGISCDGSLDLSSALTFYLCQGILLVISSEIRPITFLVRVQL